VAHGKAARAGDQGALVDVDQATDGVQGVELLGTNPVGGVMVTDDGLLVASAGSFAVRDEAGIERVSAEPPFNSTWIVREDALEGDISGFVASPDGDTFYIVVAVLSADEMGFATALKRYNVSTDTVTEVLRTEGFDLGDVALTSDGTRVLLSDRTATDPRLRVYDLATGDEVGSVSTMLPPSKLMPLGRP
ncbi:MAG: hypothetical protein AAFX99_32480, partial [Myxococcota bacterium]